ncbi:hypothetical protein GO986_18080 [Deinococcus sp. HMF7620]|uniref:Uncharacterized protein n=1 Tax=Deinococcus arboris TaxID=2682977 RepID=A0A7C9I156_9DEIO|nr:hypothetical protein [Deinococcus arboris]MVN88648.1 hypothetical protein [Deinococcus arboris]
MRKTTLKGGWPRALAITVLYVLMVLAYMYSAWVADIADTELGPPIVQEGLRALIVMNIARAFQLRWAEFTPVQRLAYLCLGLSLIGNLARGHFSGTPLTLTFALGNLALLTITTRLMAVTGQLRALAARVTELLKENTRLRARVAYLEGDDTHDHP